MINKMTRLAVLGLVVGLASATMAGEGCGSCGDSDSGAKKKSTNNVTPYYWSDLAEVQDFATKWMWSYNHDRPNMALGGFTPKQRLAMAA